MFGLQQSQKAQCNKTMIVYPGFTDRSGHVEIVCISVPGHEKTDPHYGECDIVSDGVRHTLCFEW